MAYVGQGIKNGTFSVLDTSGNTYNGSNTTFNLGTQVGSPAQLLVSHDGVIQKPVTDYTIATGGTQITFTTAPASGASIFITEISGAVGGPMNRDINGDELILDADGDTSITADTDDQIDIRVSGTDQLTIKDGALSPVTDNDIDLGTASLEFKNAYFDGTVTTDALTVGSTSITSGGAEFFFSAKNAANEAIAHQTNTKVTLGTEIFDTGADWGSSKFTAPSDGKYLFCYGGEVALSLDGGYTAFYLYKNGSLVSHSNLGSSSGSTENEQLRGSLILDLSADDYIELYVYWSDSGASGNKNATANCRLAGCKIG